MPIVARRTSEPSFDASPSWTQAAFAREVGLVRAHLAPIRSRAALAASFSREAFHTTPPGHAGDERAGAVRIAYAIRWLELDEGRLRAPWPVVIRASTGVA